METLIREEIMDTDELQNLLDAFLNRWPVEAVEDMTLQEYDGIGAQRVGAFP